MPRPQEKAAQATVERSAATPALVCRAFIAALNAAEAEAASACFTREGCLITPDATAIRGRGAIREVLGQLIDRGTRIEVELSSSLVAGEVALARERWRIRSDAPAAAGFVQRTVPTLLVHRVEGAWKLAVAAPWGMGGSLGESQ